MGTITINVTIIVTVTVAVTVTFNKLFIFQIIRVEIKKGFLHRNQHKILSNKDF